jgi:protein SCO1/2
MPERVKARLEYLLISIDPSDDQAALQSYRKQMGLARAQWTLLRGTTSGVRELAAVLGFNYARDGDQFAHNNLITLLNARGEIIHQQFGIDQSPAELAGLLGRAVEADGRRGGAAGPSD